MKFIIYLYYILRSILLRGLWSTVRLATSDLKYEKKFKIDTAKIKRSESKEFFHYQGAGYAVLLKIFSEIYPQTKEFEFVDIGCGKGRAVFVAEFCGYNNVTGIELDKELVKDAEANIERYPFKKKESTLRFIHVNALEYNYKNKPSVYFLFNPFGKEIMKQVLDRIRSLSGSETWFVYMNPIYTAPFDELNMEVLSEIKTRFYKEALVYRMNEGEGTNIT